jgi:SAM-dependent methyltransferase
VKDLFSGFSEQYATFRPTYPDELYRFIYSHVGSFQNAWDCGTGSGQVARELAKKFKCVEATDISTEQLKNAYQAPNIFYAMSGEETSIQQHSIDLITVAQAIHWFDRERFYNEVRRVAKENAVLAVWGYGLFGIGNEFDPHIRNFYFNIIGPYWDPERKLIDDRYRTISLPFAEIQTPGFSFSFSWTWEELKGYLNTWSSVKQYIRENDTNPVDSWMENIRPLWKKGRQTITFPLFARLARI